MSLPPTAEDVLTALMEDIIIGRVTLDGDLHDMATEVGTSKLITLNIHRVLRVAAVCLALGTIVLATHRAAQDSPRTPDSKRAEVADANTQLKQKADVQVVRDIQQDLDKKEKAYSQVVSDRNKIQQALDHIRELQPGLNEQEQKVGSMDCGPVKAVLFSSGTLYLTFNVKPKNWYLVEVSGLGGSTSFNDGEDGQPNPNYGVAQFMGPTTLKSIAKIVLDGTGFIHQSCPDAEKANTTKK